MNAAVLSVAASSMLAAAASQSTPRSAAERTLERQADALEAAADAVDAGVEPQTPPASRQAVAIACKLAPRFHKDMATPGESPDEFPRWKWMALPKQARCPSGRLTFQPTGFGAFVTGVAHSRDGRRWALSGGTQLAPLAGGGGECVYVREGKGFRLLGCRRTWAS